MILNKSVTKVYGSIREKQTKHLNSIQYLLKFFRIREQFFWIKARIAPCGSGGMYVMHARM